MRVRNFNEINRDSQYVPLQPRLYDSYGDPTPRPLHIALYLDRATKVNILNYLWSTGLTGPLHESVSINDMHLTLMYNGSLVLPACYPKKQVFDRQITLPMTSYRVKAWASNIVTHGSPVALIVKCDLLDRMSIKRHLKFNVTPNPTGYIYHITLSRVQLHPPNSRAWQRARFKTFADYNRLPDIDFPISFATEEVSYKS